MRVALIALILSLLLCASASAQTVGAPVVITEPAAQLEDVSADELADGETAEEDAPDDGPATPGPKRGEIHVLGTSATQAPSATAVPPSPAATRPTAQPRSETLPLTGVDAAQLAVVGGALLGAGLLTRRLTG